MSELEKQITGDWYELRTALDEPDTLVDFLDIKPPEFKGAAERLRLSVEEGVVEYKRGLLHSVMSPLKSLKWDSRAITDLNPPLREAAVGVLTPAVQRLFALGLLRLYSPKGGGAEQEPGPGGNAAAQSAGQDAGAGTAGAGAAEEGGEQAPDIKKVVQEVKKLLKERPELQQHQEVKRIMVQLKYYNTELEKMRSLAPNIPREKAAAFKKNFQTTFNEIAQKIGAAYNTLISEEIERDRPKEQLPVLKRYDFSTMDKLFREQIANAAKIYSTIRYAGRERYQMREVLVELSAGEPFYAGFFARELKQYQQLAPFGEDYLKISRAFGGQLQHYYDRYAEWLSP
ncbi:MAG: hypothetical protein K9M94_14180 [Spirochaetia bacterium]|nr:hypothetical protein [Spirochaetia bacterium]